MDKRYKFIAVDEKTHAKLKVLAAKLKISIIELIKRLLEK